MSSRISAIWAGIFLLFVAAAAALAQETPRNPRNPRKLVLITESKGFVHDVVKRKDGQPGVVEKTFAALAERSKLFTVEASQDASILTAEKLKATDVIVFYTTEKISTTPETVDAYVKAGGKFFGIHPATDTFHGDASYCSLIGGEFVAHPWNEDTPVTIKVLDDKHPAAKPWLDESARSFKEEIYQHKNFEAKNVRVILGLDMEKTALKKPFFVPIAWCKEHGKGKVFYTSLGHREDVWTNRRYQDHLIAAIEWLLDKSPGDATPNPDVSAKEDEIAKKVAPPETAPAAKPQAKSDDPPLPKAPNGFKIEAFARAPDIKSPASIAVAPDGRLFVGEDEYNTQPDRKSGLARVKLCVDTNNDGAADKFTVFADKLNSPQGMTFVGDTLFVVHAPLLTAFRDTNNDGVADERRDLITGFGPVPEGLVHHVPSGLRMGIDGWLYISIGDKGIVKATGKDGRTVSIWGGGVVRVRPDGTMMELFSSRTRNTFDCSVDPYLNVFTRDNTNDGNGWDSRLAQMQRDGEYGYPSLYKHWPDEIIEPIASYGSGSATGSVYVHEPGLHGSSGDSLFTCDWARGILYRHDLKRKGAGFDATQEEFIKDIRPADVDVDAAARLYVADWGRRDWGNAPPVGSVYRVATSRPATMPTKPAGFIDPKTLDEEQLIAELSSPSQIHRLEAQWELLRRGRSAAVMSSLTNLAMRKGELYARVAALFTLKQLAGEDSHAAIATLAAVPELREFALRALADRDDQHYGVNTDLFVQGLRDPNPRVRVQAAIGIGHLSKPALAVALVPLTADTDSLVRHAAMQSLRRLNARDVCIAALKETSRPDVMAGALRTLRSFHDESIVNAVAEVFRTAPAPATRQNAIRALATLYKVEAKWDGGWWTPHPDTRGPYYKSDAWALTPRVASLLIAAIGDADVETAKLALFYIGLIEVKEAIPQLTRTIAAGGALRDDAAKALIAMKTSTPEAIDALQRVVLGESFHADVRASAAQALAGIDAAKSQPILIALAAKLDRVAKLPDGLLGRVCDALAARAATPAQVSSLLPLLGAAKEPPRIAAATALLRSTDVGVIEQLARTWQAADDIRLAALLTAVPRLPAENAEPYVETIHKLLKDKRPPIRQAATIALGHIGDASAVKDLVNLARRDVNPLPAVAALAGIDPARIAEDQILIVATLLVETSPKAKSQDPATYGRLLGAAQKYLADPRVPTTKASSLRTQLMEPGVIYQYLKSDPIPVPRGGDYTFTTQFAPELNPAGPFGTPFSADGKEIKWSPLLVQDAKGMQPLDMPPNSVQYFVATVDLPADRPPAPAVSINGSLTCGSDDGLKVWLNGKNVLSKNEDRGLTADKDKQIVPLVPGKNTLLFRVNNRGTSSGIQARLRTRAAEFDAEEFPRILRRISDDKSRGRALFESVGCIKCHTTDKNEDPRGPFLGDVGGKFDAKYLCESIMNPSAKIAQGFATERIITTGANATDSTGFVTRETAEQIELRDPSGKVTTVRKADIKKRMPMPGSMMPDGLIDNLTIDDFGALLAYLQSLK